MTTTTLICQGCQRGIIVDASMMPQERAKDEHVLCLPCMAEKGLGISAGDKENAAYVRLLKELGLIQSVGDADENIDDPQEEPQGLQEQLL